MRAIHGLDVLLRVPIVLDEDDSVGSCQVETETTSTSREDEDLVIGVGGVEELNVAGTILGLRTTVKAEVFPTHNLEEVLHDVHNLRHLEEDEDLARRYRSDRYYTWYVVDGLLCGR